MEFCSVYPPPLLSGARYNAYKVQIAWWFQSSICCIGSLIVIVEKVCVWWEGIVTLTMCLNIIQSKPYVPASVLAVYKKSSNASQKPSLLLIPFFPQHSECIGIGRFHPLPDAPARCYKHCLMWPWLHGLQQLERRRHSLASVPDETYPAGYMCPFTACALFYILLLCWGSTSSMGFSVQNFPGSLLYLKAF